LTCIIFTRKLFTCQKNVFLINICLNIGELPKIRRVTMKRSIVLLFLMAVLLVPLQMFAQNEAGQGDLGVHFGVFQLMGGDEASKMGGIAGFNFGYLFTDKLGMDFSFSKGSAEAGQDEDVKYKTFIYPASTSLRFYLKSKSRFAPYLTAGVGFFFWELYDVTDEDETFLPFNQEGTKIHTQSNSEMFLLLGIGSRIYVGSGFALDLGLRYRYITEHDTDLSGFDDAHTGIAEARLGLNFILKCDRDTDGDGIKDKNDADPLNPEDFDGFEDEDGAPDYDNDNDGVLDVNDGAPNDPEDIDGFEDMDGVPDRDNDNDGILDVKDKAPNQPEDFDNFQDQDGAPDLDNDMDGILDVDDKCPNEPETFNKFEDEDGCPDKKPEIVFEEKAAIVIEGVNFATSSAALTDGAKEILDKVVLTLVDYPEIKLDIHGYTDSMGNRDYNVQLSQQRAESVMNYIVEMGIEPERLTSKGFGPDNPVAPNDTKDGRAKNRRIEFVRVD
jgi:outer membrane protein OmpA-like peptidoglycan-associated protein/opacity protein-like surface antigen